MAEKGADSTDVAFATLASLVASPLWISFVKPAIFFPPMLSPGAKSIG